MKRSPQRWLILSQYYAPEMGAPQIRLRNFARELQRLGIDVSVLTAMPNYPLGKIFPDYAGRWSVNEEIDGVPVKRLWVFAANTRSGLARIGNYCSFALVALSVLFGPRPDVLFVESQPLPLGLLGLLMKWLRGVPYVYNVPDLQVDVARQLGFLRGPLLDLAFGFETMLLKNAWKVSTVTRAFVEHFAMRGVPQENITFLPNGADTAFLKPQPPSKELLDRLQLDGKKVIVSVGTMAYYQALDTIVEAAEKLAAHPEFVVLMVGSGPERERIQNLVKSKGLTNVRFPRISYEESTDLYSIACAAIATFRNVAVASRMRPSKLFPALSCGVPVIFSGCGEAAELIEQNKCGIAVPPEDSAALAEAILKLANDDPLHQQFARNGRALAEREYSWAGIVERWLDGVLSAKSVSTASGEPAMAGDSPAASPQRSLRAANKNLARP
jgi:glycosyltransferase involved in cell wall biosynthesis